MHGTADLFGPVVRCLPADANVKVISYPEQTHFSYPQLEQLVVDNLPVGVPYVLIAESFSGPIALRLASRPSSDMQAVVLVSSFAFRPLGWVGRVIARMPLELALKIPPSDWIFRILLTGPKASKELLLATRKVLTKVSRNVLAARLREALTSDYCRNRISPAVRVIAICSRNDHLLGSRASGSVLNVCSTAEVANVSAPHMAPCKPRRMQL